MTTASPVLDAYDRMRKAAAVVQELERQAGIGDQGERARDVFPYDVHTDVPFGSKAFEQQSHQDVVLGYRMLTESIRRLYFSLPNLETRKALITAYRKVDSQRHFASANIVAEARARLAQAINTEVSSWAWLVGGPLGSAAGTYTLYYFAEVGAAIAYLSASIAGIAPTVLMIMQKRDVAIRNAEAELRDQVSAAEDVYRIEHSFSRDEAFTGQPDQSGEFVEG